MATAKKTKQPDAAQSPIFDAYAAEASSRNVALPTWTALDPAQLGAMFRQFDKGDFRYCVPYFESALRYDAHTKSVSDKRFSDVSSRSWEIQFLAGADAEDEDAKRQFSVCKDFFDFLRFSSVEKQDMRQGASALIEWLAGAIYLGYSAVAGEYYPAMTAEGVPTFRAHLTGVPLRYFEARDRVLRVRKSWHDYTGEAIDQGTGDWIVGVYGKTPLVQATMILYMLKVTPLEDWTHAVERFGMPFAVLKTPAKKGSAEWQAAVVAAKQIGSNFSGVFGKDVEVQVSNIAQSAGAPHMQLVEYLDRRMSILWRGGDMSTESRDVNVGGVSAQADERSMLAEADACFIEETIDSQIVQPLLKRVFGDGVRQKVFFRFTRSKSENITVAREKLNAARDCGLPISKAWTYDALGIPPPMDGEETISFPQAIAGGFPAQNALVNAEAGKDKGDEEESAENAKNRQWKAFLIALAELRDVPEADFPEALKEFADKFPQLADEVLTRNDVAEILAEYAVEEMRKELSD